MLEKHCAIIGTIMMSLFSADARAEVMLLSEEVEFVYEVNGLEALPEGISSVATELGLERRLGGLILSDVNFDLGASSKFSHPESVLIEQPTDVVGPVVEGQSDNEDRAEILVERNRSRRIDRLEVAYHVFNAADAVLTVTCLQREGCTELNPLYGDDPDPIVVVGTKVAWSVGYHFLLAEIEKRDGDLAEIMAWATTIIQGGVVGYNISQTF